ncbi:MAG: PAS domain S-box protein [Acidobacteria bacterium]|nr:PAS domain S-box protein [Acidobacteriota bacterium]
MLGLAALLLAVCSGGGSAPPAVLRAGYAEFRPYSMKDDQGGPAGMAVEVVRQAAQRAGVRLEWVYEQNAEEALRQGRIDLYPLFTVTPERLREFHMSEPWWEYSQLLVSLRRDPLESPAEAVGRKIAVRGIAGVSAVGHAALPGTFLIPLAGASEILAALCVGQVDGALVEGRLLSAALLEGPGVCGGRPLQARPLPGAVNQMATISTRAEARAADRVYAAIRRMVADGTVNEIANRWVLLPQQRFLRQRLLERDRWYFALLYAAAILLLVISLWLWRGARASRRDAEKAWRAVRDAERRFETFMAHSPAVALLKDAQGRILFFNRAFEGLRPGPLAGKTDAELWPPDVVARMRAHDAEVLANGQPLQYMLSIPSAAGEARDWLVLKFRVSGEVDAPLIGVNGIDVTDQQRAAALVRESEERYRAVFEQAPLAMHELDGEGIVRRVNRAECALLGLDADRILGRHASEFAAPEERVQSRASVAAKLAGRKPMIPFERAYQRSDGTRLIVEVHESPILGPGGAVRGIRTCLVDLSERYDSQRRLDEFASQLQEKNAELAEALRAAEEGTRLKSQFLANMSHEIRTPLNGVLGMAELLLGGTLTQEQRSLAGAVRESGLHLAGIINDILDFSKIEAGRMELEHIGFDLWQTVYCAAEMMAPAAHAKGLHLVCQVEPETPHGVVGDAARLRQVLLNLTGNAVKFTAEGEIAVSVTGRLREDGRTALVGVSVTDSGIGIPEAAIHTLFTAFTQADSTTTRRFGGTGLGLAISRRIVELMGGKMGVSSREGNGSVFWFNLEMEVDPQAAQPEAAVELRGRRILILEEHELSRAVLMRYAQNWAMQASRASGGREALRRLHEAADSGAPFDFLLLSADMEALGLCRTIERDSSLDGLHTVLMTPLGMPAPVGAKAAVISKPVKPCELMGCLASFLQSRDAEPPAPAEPAKAAAAEPSPARILIAEDNPVNQRVASLQLRSLGYQSDVVDDGEAALEALSRREYALVLMDCQMPRLDGIAATRRLRQREGDLRHTPVIALTANAFESDREDCLAAGMDEFLSKPVSMASLASVLERWTGSPRPPASGGAPACGITRR